MTSEIPPSVRELITDYLEYVQTERRALDGMRPETTDRWARKTARQARAMAASQVAIEAGWVRR